MGSLVDHGLSCPFCGSSDAYAEYTDNYYCFSCHKSKPKVCPTSHKTKPKVCPTSHKIALPEDYTTDIPGFAKAYLYKHGFDDSLIHFYFLGWSDNCWIWSKRKQQYFNAGPRLILPCYDDKAKLLFFEAKSLDPNEKLKYVGEGGKGMMYRAEPFLKGSVGITRIVIVEDMISAMRIGSMYRAIALRGTCITDKKLLELKNDRWNKYILWLDSDKAGRKAATKIETKLRWFADDITKVFTDKDPKCYTDAEIIKTVEGK